jgi:hypothetical protein
MDHAHAFGTCTTTGAVSRCPLHPQPCALMHMPLNPNCVMCRFMPYACRLSMPSPLTPPPPGISQLIPRPWPCLQPRPKTPAQMQLARLSVIGHTALAPQTARISSRLTTHTGEREPPPPTLFVPAPLSTHRHSALSTSTGPTRTWGSAVRRRSVLETQPLARTAISISSPTAKGKPSALISSSPRVAPASVMAPLIVAPDAELSSTVQPSVLADWLIKPVTPLLFSGRHSFTHKHSLVNKYPSVFSTLRHGTIIGVPPIKHSFTPPNKPPISYYSAQFLSILQHEYSSRCQFSLVNNSEVQQAWQIPPRAELLLPSRARRPHPVHQHSARLLAPSMYMGHFLYHGPLHHSPSPRIASCSERRGRSLPNYAPSPVTVEWNSHQDR